jgi:acyl carrier protein
MDVAESVNGFLKERSVVSHDAEIAADTSLLDSGLLDSAGLFELVSFLEERFGITIEDEELLPENFDTIDEIVALVGPKIERAQAGGGAAA